MAIFNHERTTGNFYTTLMQLAGFKRETLGMLDPNLQDIDIHGPLTELLA